MRLLGMALAGLLGRVVEDCDQQNLLSVASLSIHIVMRGHIPRPPGRMPDMQ